MRRQLTTRAVLGNVREYRIWRLILGTTVALSTLAFALLPLVSSVYDARIARDAARIPTVAESPAPADIAGFVNIEFAMLGLRDVTVVSLEQSPNSSRPPPPGLAQWPAAGDVYASPELIALTGGRTFADSYGEFVGEISPTALTDPAELILYVGIDRSIFHLPGNWATFTGFGSPADGTTDAGYLGSALYQAPRTSFWTGIALFCLAPAVVVTTVAIRLGGEHRDTSVAILQSLGASPRAIVRALLQATAGPVFLGALGGMLCLATVAFTNITIPIVGYPLTGADLRPALLLAFLSSTAVAVVTLLGVVLAHRPWRVRFNGARTSPRPARRRVWALWALAGAIAAANWGYVAFYQTDPGLALLCSLLGGAVAVAVLGPAAAPLFSGIASAMLRIARRCGSSSLLIASREIAHFSRASVRVCVVVSMVMILALQMQVLRSQGSEIVRNASISYEANANRVLMSDNLDGEDLTWLPTLMTNYSDEYAVATATVNDEGELNRLWVPCSQPISVINCSRDDNILTASDLERTRPELNFYGLNVTATTIADERIEHPDLLLYISTTDAALDPNSVRADLRASTSPVPVVHAVGQSSGTGATIGARHALWIIPGAALAAMMALVAGAGALLIELARTRERIRGVLPLTSTGHIAALATWLVGMPLLLAGVLGLTVGTALTAAPTSAPGTFAALSAQTYVGLAGITLATATCATAYAYFVLRRSVDVDA